MSSVRPAQSPTELTLADYAALFIRCEDCGNGKRMGPETLAGLVERGHRLADSSLVSCVPGPSHPSAQCPSKDQHR
jgi:hypothetical protein